MAKTARQALAIAAATLAACGFVGCLAAQGGRDVEANNLKVIDDIEARVTAKLKAELTAQIAAIASTDNSRRETRSENRSRSGRDTTNTTSQGVTSDDIHAMFIGFIKWAGVCYVGHMVIDALKDLLIARRYTSLPKVVTP